MSNLTIFLTICAMLVSVVAPAQEKPENLVKAVANKIHKVEKYTADIRIKIDVDFVKIQERKAKVFFEKPDKFEIKASGIALLPKRGAEMEYLELFTTEYTAIEEKKEQINGVETRLIKVIPMNSDIDIVLAQLWIDEPGLRIMRMQTYTKSAGSYIINFTYANNPFDLPASIAVEFDVKNMSIPASISGDMEALAKRLEKKEVTNGKVLITYSNYVVNKE